MSHDLRRKLAYFGPREKVYSSDNTEIEGLPRTWRRVLGMSYPFPVVGPFGCVYADIEHALCASRYMYTSNRPIYGQMFRAEVNRFAGSSMCRRWGSANGMSLLLTDPNDRIWFLVRDRCMFDFVYQRIARDEVYRHVLETLIDAQYLPVYHVRTANEMTYWGATMNRESTSNTLTDRSPKEDLETMYLEASRHSYSSPKELLVGENRLGEIMVDAIQAYRQVQSGISTTRVNGLIQNDFEKELTPLGKHTISEVERELEEEEEDTEDKKCFVQPKSRPKKSRKTQKKVVNEPPSVAAAAAAAAEEEEEEEVMPEETVFFRELFQGADMDVKTANEILRIAGIGTDEHEDDPSLYSLF